MAKKPKQQVTSVCTAPDCGRKTYATGHCKRHYMQILRHGQLTPQREHRGPTPCSAPACKLATAIHGYCRKHARQIRLYGQLTPDREYLLGQKSCAEPGCTAHVRAKALCARHYNKGWRKANDAGANQPQ